MAHGETLFCGGLLADGSGDVPVLADVRIRGGLVAEVGPDLQTSAGSEVVNAAGMIVAPGFIDCHTHYDRSITWDGIGRHCSLQGLTTVVGGNCGVGPANMADHLDAAEEARPGVNYTCLVGLSSVRADVKGPIAEAPTSDEVRQMTERIEEALDAGAVGVSWGPYGSAQFQETEEVMQLVEPAGRRGRVFSTHRRNERAQALEATREAIDIARHAGARLVISHLKVIGPNGFPLLEPMLDLIRRTIAQGWPVWCDAYPYTGAATGISTLLPEWAKEGNRTHELLADPAERTRIIPEIEAGIADRCTADDILCFSRDVQGVFGLSLAEAAEGRGITPAEMVIELVMTDEKAGGGGAVYRNTMREDQVQRILSEPYCSVAADSGVTPEENRPLRGGHPRSFGTSAKAFRWAREGRIGTVGEVVRQCTSLPGEALGISDRGLIEPGKIADITVFDPARIEDTSTYLEPAQYPVGIEHVLLGGRWMVRDGWYVGEGRGQVLREWSSH